MLTLAALYARPQPPGEEECTKAAADWKRERVVRYEALARVLTTDQQRTALKARHIAQEALLAAARAYKGEPR